jgi:biotin synthase-like enzyme
MKQKNIKMSKMAKKKRIKNKNEKCKKGCLWRQEIVASVRHPKKGEKHEKKGVPLETRNSAFCDEAKNEK